MITAPSKCSPEQLIRTGNWEGKAKFDPKRGLWIPYGDPVGLPTIYVGHLIKAGENFDAGITDAQGLSLLGTDMRKCEISIDALGLDLDQHEIDALCDAVFNCGAGVLLGLVGRCLRAGDRQGAGDALLAWCHAPAGIVNAGLLSRRKAERALLLDPSAVLPTIQLHEPGLRPVPPTEEIEAQGAALWLSDRPDYGGRDLSGN